MTTRYQKRRQRRIGRKYYHTTVQAKRILDKTATINRALGINRQPPTISMIAKIKMYFRFGNNKKDRR